MNRMGRRFSRPTRLARNTAFLLGLLPLQATAALAAEPTATYRIQASTSSSQMPTAPSLGQMLMGNAAMGSKRQIQRNLELTLTAPVAPPAKPEASHAIPAAMAMGATLSLEASGDCTKGECGSQEIRQAVEQMRSQRVLLYWGCEAKAGAGQPQTLEASKNPLLIGMEQVLRQDKGEPTAPSLRRRPGPRRERDV